MNLIILIVHIVVAVLLILMVLLQVGKGASLSNLFGGGSSEAIFSGAGGDIFMKRVTIVLAIIFALTSLGLTMMTSKPGKKSIMQKIPYSPPASAPQTPAQ